MYRRSYNLWRATNNIMGQSDPYVSFLLMQVVIVQKGLFNLQTHIGQAKQIVINECVMCYFQQIS